MLRILLLILVLLSSAAFSFISKPASPKTKPFLAVPKPTSPLFDIIGKSSEKDLIARFEALKVELLEEKKLIAYIINKGTEYQIRKREKQIRKAIAFHKIDTKKVVIISGNSDYFETRIYIIPENAESPTP